MSQPRRLVVDASVAAKWYLPELDAAKARQLLRSENELLAPELLLAEVGNVLWKKVRRGELEPQEVPPILDELLSAPVRLVRHAPHIRLAFTIANRFDRTLYDALYVAVALAEQAALVTADERLVNAFSGSEFSAAVVGLGDVRT